MGNTQKYGVLFKTNSGASLNKTVTICPLILQPTNHPGKKSWVLLQKDELTSNVVCRRTKTDIHKLCADIRFGLLDIQRSIDDMGQQRRRHKGIHAKNMPKWWWWWWLCRGGGKCIKWLMLQRDHIFQSHATQNKNEAAFQPGERINK